MFDVRCSCFAFSQQLPDPSERIVKLVHDALLERNDGVVRDRDVLGTDLRAALGDVAVTDALGLFQFLKTVRGVERVHLQRGNINEETRADEFLVFAMFTQDVADILAEEAFDALAEFLHAIDVRLRHAPRAVRRIRRTRLERFYFLLHPEIPRDIGDEILHARECFHRLDRHRFLERQLIEPRHAHQPRHPIHLRRTRPALTRFAIPPAREIGRLLRLDLMHRVEHDHAFAHLSGVVLKRAGLGVAAPDAEGGGGHGKKVKAMKGRVAYPIHSERGPAWKADLFDAPHAQGLPECWCRGGSVRRTEVAEGTSGGRLMRRDVPPATCESDVPRGAEGWCRAPFFTMKITPSCSSCLLYTSPSPRDS